MNQKKLVFNKRLLRELRIILYKYLLFLHHILLYYNCAIKEQHNNTDKQYKNDCSLTFGNFYNV